MPSFTGLVDLAVDRNGGVVEEASDDFFAPKERLILQEAPLFKAGVYTEDGKWMDGWESRRKRTPGNDWCIIRLGLPGRIRGVDIDTSYFVGNHPPEASLDVEEFIHGDENERRWSPLLPRVPLKPDTHNLFDVESDVRARRLRLNIFPDGGVARLRVFGDVAPDWSSVGTADIIELSSLQYGGKPLACSDEHFGRTMNLLRADRAANMGDGWETRRRRTEGHDWVVICLGKAGILDRLEVDTSHFKGNHPDRCSVDACLNPDSSNEIPESAWIRILDERTLQPDTVHSYANLAELGPFDHLRLNIYPDGGVARFRAFGSLPA